jgi:hypothetical protein
MSEHKAKGYRRQLEEIEHDYLSDINAQNRSNDRRIGYAMQAFMPPHAQQILGRNYWLNI